MSFRKLIVARLSPDELKKMVSDFKAEYAQQNRPIYIMSQHYKNTTRLYMYDKDKLYQSKERQEKYNIVNRKTPERTKGQRKPRSDKGKRHNYTKTRNDKGKIRKMNEVSVDTYNAMLKLLDENNGDYNSIKLDDVRQAFVC